MTGFNSKQAMAVDKLQEPSATRPCRSCNGTGDRDTGIPEFPIATCKPCNGTGQIALAQPAQEPVACTDERMCVPCYTGQGTCDCTQQFKFWSVTGRCERQAFASFSGAEAYCKGLNTAHPDENYVVRPLWEIPPAVQPAQEPEILTIVYQSGYHDGKQAALAGREWNFCERCGKRTKDLSVIHTCTPPQGDA